MSKSGHLRREHKQRYAVALRQLRVARDAAGITQVEVAERLRNTQTFVSKVERGERRLDIIDWIDYLEAIGADQVVSLRDLLRQLRDGSS